MNPFCPNLSDPQIKQEFEELIDAVGENKAYYLWDKNQGYSIDRAPDGAPSKLFQSHLFALNGDRAKAIKATANDIIAGRTHNDSLLQYGVNTGNPIENITATVEEIGLDNLIDALTDAGVGRDVADVIYKTAKDAKDLRGLKPIDIFNISLQQRDHSLKREYNKRILAPLNKKLEEHLIKILERFKFKIKDMSEFETDDPQLNLEKITAALDIFNKIIYASQNRNDITMPEEFAHAFFRLMGLVTTYNPTIEKLYQSITKSSLYKQVYEKYKDVYAELVDDPYNGPQVKPNESKIREEAIGQALAAVIVSKYEYNEQMNIKKPLFTRLKDWLFDVFDRINDSMNQFLGTDTGVSSQKDTDDRDIIKTLEKLADEILNDNLKSLDQVDDTNFNRLDFSETIRTQNEKDGGLALRFMNKIVSLGAIITGSLSYRMQGTIYRSSLDSLHDIDCIVPFGTHETTPFGFWHLEHRKKWGEVFKSHYQTPKFLRGKSWEEKLNEYRSQQLNELADHMRQIPFFEELFKEWPDMKFTAIYVHKNDWKRGFTVSTIWSSDNNLSDKFLKLSGSYADRLKQFTEEERSKIYLFDFFMYLRNEVPTTHDYEFGLDVASYEESFDAKAHMGRPKDNYDYQRWEVFEKYKKLPDRKGLLFQIAQDQKPVVDETEVSYSDPNDLLDIYTNEDEYVSEKIKEYATTHPNMTDADINIKRRQFTAEYVERRQREIMSDTSIRLAEAFGLVRQGDGSWVAKDPSDPMAKLRVEFVNSIDPDTAGLYEHNSMSISAHHVIRIGLDKGDPTTFNHEMAHHYLRMFWNSKVVQEALKMVDKPGMSDTEREEALVEKMVEISIDNVYGTVFEKQNFFHTFWNKFANLLYNIFDIQTNTVRNQILQNATRSFMLNEQLSGIEDERVMFEMADETMYSKTSRGKFRSRKETQKSEPTYMSSFTTQDEELTEAIIKHTEGKDKAYTRRGGVNERQLIKLQEAVYSVRQSAQRIKEAIAAHDVAKEFHEKADLIIQYMERASIEISSSVNMFNSAMANGYREFVYRTNPDGSVTYDQLGQMENPERRAVTFEDLVNIKSDILSYHANLIGAIGKMLRDTEAIKNFSTSDIDRIRDKYNTLRLNEKINTFQNAFNVALDKACVRDIIQYIDENVALEEDLKNRLKINMLKWLKDQNDFGEISIYEQWIGLGSHSKSPVIRMMQDIINDLLYERDVPVEERGKEIKTLLENARKSTTKGLIGISKYNIKIGKFNLPTPWNIQKLLMEMDDRGLPTGNWITKLNRGKYQHRKEDFISELMYGSDGNSGVEAKIREFEVNGSKPYANFELKVDKYNTPIFPEDSQLDDIIRDYYTKLEKWRCENEDRQFTEKYYMERVKRLSPTTLQAMDRVHSSISEIYSSCTVGGVVRIDLLTGKQLHDLEEAKRRRAQLYNFYHEDGTMKAPGTIEYRIAEELAEWSLFIKDKVVYKIDTEGFEKAKSLAKNKAKFDDDNTEVVINPKVWEYYQSVVTTPYKHMKNDSDVQKLELLIYKRNKLLNQIKANAYGFYNMAELYDINTKQLKNKEYWKSLQSLETSIHNLRSILKDRYKNATSAKRNKEGFASIFDNVYQPINENGPLYGNTVPRWFSEIYNHVRVTSPDDLKLLFLKGTQQPLGIFSALIPTYSREENVVVNGRIVKKKYQTNDSGEEYETFIRQPNSNFSVIDTENSDAEWVNKDFDRSTGKSYAPKMSVYENKDFQKIENNPALNALYTKLIDTMEESWKKIPFLGDYDYRLPQERARFGQVMGRRRNIFKNIGFQLSSWWEINETDEWFNNDYQTRPDGSRMDFIPVRFIKRLDRPEYISSDVCGSVIDFFEMARNYEVKSKVVPQFEAYIERLGLNDNAKQRSWNDVSQQSILNHITDVQMYGREQEFVANSKKKDSHSSNTIKLWLKRVKQSRGWAQASLLAFNFSSAIVSALDPMVSLTLDMMTGKYTNYDDFFFALGVMGLDSPRAIASLGAIKTYSKANAGMQFFQLSKNNKATFKDMDKSQFVRFMTDGLPMKVFTIGDYTINCITMISTMHNYRLYTKESTGVPVMDLLPGRNKFLKKEEFIRQAILDGKTQEEALRLYKNGVSLWEAFELKDGSFSVKAEFKNVIDDTTLKNVRKQVQSRSAVYNGVVPDAERTKLQTNVWTSFITMLRNFLVMGINERFKSQRDFQVPNYEEYSRLGINVEERLLNSDAQSIYRTKKEQSYLKGGYNFSTRTIEDGVFIGFGDVIRNMYGRTKYFLGSIARTADKNYAAKQDIYQLSEFDKYAGKKVTLELMSFAMLMILALYANSIADREPDDYWAQLMALVLTRLPSERFTFYSPTLVSDIITSPTSAMSAFRRFLLIFNLAADLAGMSDHSPDDLINNGTYGGYRRWVRDICGILSGYGAHNLITNTNARSLREKNKFYWKILPVNLKTLDAIMEIFGVDFLDDNRSSRSGGGLSSGLGSGLGGGLSSGL